LCAIPMGTHYSWSSAGKRQHRRSDKRHHSFDVLKKGLANGMK
jgi:hypothetical protein